MNEVKAIVAKRPTLETLARDGSIGRGRLAKLYNMFYAHGPGNGTFLSLPFDQLVEHGPGHMFKWERAAQPEAVIELANRGNYSALVLSIGQAEKYQNLIRPDLSLIVKIDGHFLIGKDISYPRHTNFSSIERALKAGADAIGLTFYIGSEETGQDVERIGKIVEKAHEYGLPVVIWGYARGPIPNKVGADSLLWCHYAVSAVESLGGDIVKTKFPAPVKPEKKKEYEDYIKNYIKSKIPEAEYYLELEPEDPNNVPYELHIERMKLVVNAAPHTFVIVSGGPKVKDPEKELVYTTNIVMDAGAEGRIIGRNFWGQPIEKGLELTQIVTKEMQKPQYYRPLTEPRFTGKY